MIGLKSSMTSLARSCWSMRCHRMDRSTSATTCDVSEGIDRMQFGFTLKPEHTIERTLALTRQAEAAGFDYGWLFDSHVLWRSRIRC